MIVYNAQLASALAAVYPLTNARILYQNHARGLLPSAVTASTDSTDNPKDAVLRPDTGEFWKPTALPATLLIDLGSAKAADAIGIGGHSLGSSGCVVRAMFTADPSAPDPYVFLPGTVGNWIGMPDSTAAEVLSDIDVRVKLALDDWTHAGVESYVLNKGQNSRSWLFATASGGGLVFYRYSDGTNLVATNASVSGALPFTNGQAGWIRATRVASTGAVNFYTSTDGVVWTQFGAADRPSTAGNNFNSAEGYNLGGLNSAADKGKYFYAEIRNGINGNIVAKMDASEATDGATTLNSTSPNGEVWTLHTNSVPAARINNDVVGTGSAGYLPIDDNALMFIFPSATKRYLHLRITSSGAILPRIASVYVGAALTMQKQVSGPYVPITLGRTTKLFNSMSRGGQFLGQSYQRNGLSSSAMFKNLDDSWVRSNFDAFSKAVRRYPYFFAWNPSLFPSEVGYVWSEKDIVPKYNAIGNLMDVSWEMHGVGSAQ